MMYAAMKKTSFAAHMVKRTGCAGRVSMKVFRVANKRPYAAGVVPAEQPVSRQIDGLVALVSLEERTA